MGSRFFHIPLAILLAVVLLFGTIPKEAVHLCANHKDTVHTHHDHKSYLEKTHHHCSFLDLALTPFANDIQKITFYFSDPIILSIFPFSEAKRLYSNPTHTALRGPPSLT